MLRLHERCRKVTDLCVHVLTFRQRVAPPLSSKAPDSACLIRWTLVLISCSVLPIRVATEA